MKQLFKNYNLEFDKNEKKIVTTFCKQVLKQINDNNQYYAETKAFNSILDKLNSSNGSVKFTKDEYTRLKNQLNQNIKYLQNKIKKGNFITKWFYKSLLSNYNSLYENYFKG